MYRCCSRRCFASAWNWKNMHVFDFDWRWWSDAAAFHLLIFISSVRLTRFRETLQFTLNAQSIVIYLFIFLELLYYQIIKYYQLENARPHATCNQMPGELIPAPTNQLFRFICLLRVQHVCAIQFSNGNDYQLLIENRNQWLTVWHGAFVGVPMRYVRYRAPNIQFI